VLHDTRYAHAKTFQLIWAARKGLRFLTEIQEYIMNLSFESLIILLIVGALVGLIGQKLAGVSRGGLLTSIAIGIVGALIGSWAVKQFGLPEIYDLRIAQTSLPIVWAIIGAAILVGTLGLLTRRRYV
jgi:uncharacterized membrane protein YeaQ/YmgE (transglycosylase-associated protein family)